MVQTFIDAFMADCEACAVTLEAALAFCECTLSSLIVRYIFNVREFAFAPLSK
jgi:hypothetical protein